jgi:hypothetical protein
MQGRVQELEHFRVLLKRIRPMDSRKSQFGFAGFSSSGF